MQGSAKEQRPNDSIVVHAADASDAAITAAMRAAVKPTKGVARGIEARSAFDALMEGVLPRDDVTFQTDTLRGVPGIWVLPPVWQRDEAILHLHAGWFCLGSARAFRHLVGHLGARAGART